MTDEKIKNKKSFHIKGILILIFLTFVSSLPIAIEELKSNTQIGHILFVGEFIGGSLGGILGSTIISAIITFLGVRIHWERFRTLCDVVRLFIGSLLHVVVHFPATAGKCTTTCDKLNPKICAPRCTTCKHAPN